jgi:hypothetical protein
MNKPELNLGQLELLLKEDFEVEVALSIDVRPKDPNDVNILKDIFHTRECVMQRFKLLEWFGPTKNYLNLHEEINKEVFEHNLKKINTNTFLLEKLFGSCEPDLAFSLNYTKTIAFTDNEESYKKFLLINGHNYLEFDRKPDFYINNCRNINVVKNAIKIKQMHNLKLNLTLIQIVFF